MEFLVQNLHLVGPISLALLPVSIFGIAFLNVKRARG